MTQKMISFVSAFMKNSVTRLCQITITATACYCAIVGMHTNKDLIQVGILVTGMLTAAAGWGYYNKKVAGISSKIKGSK